MELGSDTRNKIAFRFVTTTSLIDGWILSPHRRLVDILNTQLAASLTIFDAVIRQHTESPASAGTAPFADINSGLILYAVPTQETAAEGLPRDPMVWIKKSPIRARVGLGAYVIEGDIHLVDGASLEGALARRSEPFVPMTSATVRRPDDPLFSEDLPIIFINRQRLEYVMPA